MTIPERVQCLGDGAVRGVRGTQRVACQGQVRLGLCQALLLRGVPLVMTK